MKTWSLLLAATLVALSWGGLAHAKKAKTDPFAAFSEELLQTTGLDEDGEKAIKMMGKCNAFDVKWQRQLQDPHTYSLWDTDEQIRTSIACWEKVAKKHSTHNDNVDEWVGAWHQFLQGAEMWVWSRIAMQEGDRDNYCKRLTMAKENLATVGAEHAELHTRFTTTEGQDLGSAPVAAAQTFGDQARQMLEESGCE